MGYAQPTRHVNTMGSSSPPRVLQRQPVGVRFVTEEEVAEDREEKKGRGEMQGNDSRVRTQKCLHTPTIQLEEEV